MTKIILFCILLTITASAQWRWNNNGNNGKTQTSNMQAGNTVQQVDTMVELDRTWVDKIHKEIYETVFRNDMNKYDKRKNIIKYDYSKLIHKKYLQSLASLALLYIDDPSYINKLKFLHLYQRPPKNYVKMVFEPTVYYISITKIAINLSDVYYESLKGYNDADPSIFILKRLNDKKITWDSRTDWQPTVQLWSISGPTNTKNFSLTQNGELNDLTWPGLKVRKIPYEEILETHIKTRTEMWWNLEDDCDLIIKIIDSDGSFFDAETLTAVLKGKDLIKTDEATWRFNNGTIMTLSWTVK